MELAILAIHEDHPMVRYYLRKAPRVSKRFNRIALRLCEMELQSGLRVPPTCGWDYDTEYWADRLAYWTAASIKNESAGHK